MMSRSVSAYFEKSGSRLVWLFPTTSSTSKDEQEKETTLNCFNRNYTFYEFMNLEIRINKCEPFIHSFEMRKHFYKRSLTLHSLMLSYLFPSSLFPFDLS